MKDKTYDESNNDRPICLLMWSRYLRVYTDLVTGIDFSFGQMRTYTCPISRRLKAQVPLPQRPIP